jgi:hypothetical protein
LRPHKKADHRGTDQGVGHEVVFDEDKGVVEKDLKTGVEEKVKEDPGKDNSDPETHSHEEGQGQGRGHDPGNDQVEVGLHIHDFDAPEPAQLIFMEPISTVKAVPIRPAKSMEIMRTENSRNTAKVGHSPDPDIGPEKITVKPRDPGDKDTDDHRAEKHSRETAQYDFPELIEPFPVGKGAFDEPVEKILVDFDQSPTGDGPLRRLARTSAFELFFVSLLLVSERVFLSHMNRRVRR